MKQEFLQFEMKNNSFPLTPALSLGERGKRSQIIGKATAEGCSIAAEFYQRIQRLFPLPWGEGQGEGEGNANLFDGSDLKFHFRHTFQGSSSCSPAS